MMLDWELQWIWIRISLRSRVSLAKLKTINCNDWKTSFTIGSARFIWKDIFWKTPLCSFKTKNCLHSLTFRLCWIQTGSQNSKTLRTFLDQWEACLTIWGGREERRKEDREKSQGSLLTVKEGENWKRQGGGLGLWCQPAPQRSFCPAMVTLKTTRPPYPCEWTRFKCRHPSQ